MLLAIFADVISKICAEFGNHISGTILIPGLMLIEFPIFTFYEYSVRTF